MNQIIWHIVAPFAVGFSLGGVFCAGLCVLDVGGFWTLANSTNAKMPLLLEFAWFASLFGTLSFATHHAMRLVWNR